jgi:hypothetical protein
MQLNPLDYRASDNDEEFMLIEAADHLPGWLNPETAENRVRAQLITEEDFVCCMVFSCNDWQ